MFRMQMPPQVDPAEERRQVKESVRSNLLLFAALCGAIRLAPIVLSKIAGNNIA